jgi:hypothetical protein
MVGIARLDSSGAAARTAAGARPAIKIVRDATSECEATRLRVASLLSAQLKIGGSTSPAKFSLLAMQ